MKAVDGKMIWQDKKKKRFTSQVKHVWKLNMYSFCNLKDTWKLNMYSFCKLKDTAHEKGTRYQCPGLSKGQGYKALQVVIQDYAVLRNAKQFRFHRGPKVVLFYLRVR